MRREKRRKLYDLESYPNFFSAIFEDEVSGKRDQFVIFADTEDDSRSINQIGELVDYMEGAVQWVIGYNNHNYDDVLLKKATIHASRLRVSHPKVTAFETNVLSNGIIQTERGKSKPPIVYSLMNVKTPWRSMDLMQLFNPGDQVGLKRLAISLRWPIIEDLPYPPGSIIKHDQIAHILKYQGNDIDMTKLVKNELADAINNRISYYVKYGTDIVNSCNSQIGRQIMEDLYAKHANIDPKEFKDKCTEYETLALKECIVPKIHFLGMEYNRVLAATQQAVIDPNLDEDDENVIVIRKKKKKKNTSQFEVLVRSKYITHTMKLGGMHSNGVGEIMESNSKYVYIDLDVEGYYPRIICNENLYPAHLDPSFTGIFKEHIVDRRKPIKKSNPVLAYMLKIAANAAFGQTDVKGDIKSWLKDPKMAKTITISGQLYLLMLMEGLEEHSNCMVVYSNTDGMTVRVPRTEIKQFYNICQRWELYTGFTLEYKTYRKMIIRDVNNYLIFVDTDDESERIKAKGIYQYENTMATDLKSKGFAYPIIAMAVREWFDKGIPVEDTIYGCTSIYEFMKAQNTSPEKYDVILYYSDFNMRDKHLQKNNRWIVTKGNPYEGRMIKIKKEDGKRSEMQKGYKVTEVNNVYDEITMEDYCINYDFYINQAYQWINITKPLNKETHIPLMRQGELFAV